MSGETPTEVNTDHRPRALVAAGDVHVEITDPGTSVICCANTAGDVRLIKATIDTRPAIFMIQSPLLRWLVSGKNGVAYTPLFADGLPSPNSRLSVFGKMRGGRWSSSIQTSLTAAVRAVRSPPLTRRRVGVAAAR